MDLWDLGPCSLRRWGNKQGRNQLLPSALAKPLSEKEDQKPRVREESLSKQQQEDAKLGRKGFTKCYEGGVVF